MSEQPEALRLVQRLAHVCKYSDSEHWDDLDAAAAELRRLHAEVEHLKKMCYDYLGLVAEAARKPTNAHDKIYSEVDLANAYQKGWNDAMLRRSLDFRARSNP
jgi:hypothetical protein